MNRFGKRFGLFASAAMALASVAGVARADDAAEIKALKDRLQALEAKQQKLETEKVSSAEVDRAVSDAVKEAQTKAAAPSEGFTGGYTSDKGFVIRSTDGNFLIHPNLQLAIRNVTNYREDFKASGDADTQNGFELRRVKLGFDGNLFGPDLKYNFIWSTDRKGGALGLEEAYAIYKLGTFGALPQPVSVQAGQFKNYFAHESMLSSKRVFAVERSLVNDVFTGGDNFVQGVALLYNEGTSGGPLQAALVFNDGSNDFSAPPSSTSRNFQDFPTNKWDWGAAARVQYKVMGNWKDYDDFNAATATGNPLLVIGAALDYSEAGDFAQTLYTADAQYKSGPIAIYGAFLGRDLRHGGNGGSGSGTPSPATAGLANLGDWGFVGKVGYAVDKNLEVFGQYSYISFDQDEFANAAIDNHVHEITAGFNYFLKGHSAKFTLDGTWLPNGSPVNSDGGGILAQPNGRNEFILRIQFQLLI